MNSTQKNLLTARWQAGQRSRLGAFVGKARERNHPRMVTIALKGVSAEAAALRALKLWAAPSCPGISRALEGASTIVHLGIFSTVR